MQQKNSAGNFLNDMQSTFKELINSIPAASPFGFQTILETQRKNIQALTEANQMVLQGWQALAQRQTEMVSQFVQDNSGLARETMTEGTPQEKFSKQSEIIKLACVKSISNTQELAEILRKSTADTAEVLNRRLVASLAEINTAKEEI